MKILKYISIFVLFVTFQMFYSSTSYSGAMPPVEVFDVQLEFENETGASPLGLPGSEDTNGFPGTSCGTGNEPTGGDLTVNAEIMIPFNGNSLTIMQDDTDSINPSRGLCIFDPGFTPTNTNPLNCAGLQGGSLIVGNGEDDYLIVFDTPVDAVGFELLTNDIADEEVTLKDDNGDDIEVIDIDSMTNPETIQFIGFKSDTPIKSVLINTVNGENRNEGICEIKVVHTVVPIVDVFDVQAEFEEATGAEPLGLPDSEDTNGFPGTTCGNPVLHEPSGIGSQIGIPFNNSILTITGTNGNDLCIFDSTFNPGLGNTDPLNCLGDRQEPLGVGGSLIVANGEDDYTITFDSPVDAVGFELLTNSTADETVTLKDDNGDDIEVIDINLLTNPNTIQFVGFVSSEPIKSVLIDTVFGATQNEGICEIKVVVDRPVFLIIDEDSIDNGGPYFVGGTPVNFGGTESEFIDTDVNDDIADLGLRAELPFFADPPANIGNTITLLTGEMGDEAWFAPNVIPDTWASTGPTPDGIRNFVGLPGGVGPGLGTGPDPEALLDKIPDVRPLRAEGLNQLIGKQVCAVVYDSDISINYDPLDGSLKGANYGIVAFEVISVTSVAGLPDFSDSSLPEVEIVILDAEEVCDSDLMLFDAPVPMSSSEEIDVLPDGVVPDASG